MLLASTFVDGRNRAQSTQGRVGKSVKSTALRKKLSAKLGLLSLLVEFELGGIRPPALDCCLITLPMSLALSFLSAAFSSGPRYQR